MRSFLAPPVISLDRLETRMFSYFRGDSYDPGFRCICRVHYDLHFKSKEQEQEAAAAIQSFEATGSRRGPSSAGLHLLIDAPL